MWRARKDGRFAAVCLTAAAIFFVAVACSTATTVKAPPPAPDAISVDELITIEPTVSPTPSPSPSPTAAPRSTSEPEADDSPHVHAAPAAATGPVNCPSGSVEAELTDFDADNKGSTSSGVDRWEVNPRGIVSNNTSHPVNNIRMQIIVYSSGGDPDEESVVISKYVAAGGSAQWRTTHTVRSQKQPDEDDVRMNVLGWSWGDPALASCPTN